METKRQLKVEKLPRAALCAISKRQRSYIDEFTFAQRATGQIEAWYAGELLALWDGSCWQNPYDQRVSDHSKWE